MTQAPQYTTAVNVLQTARRPLAVVGALDPDSLGACVALVRTMQANGAVGSLFSDVVIPDNFQYLIDPSIRIVSDASQVTLENFDAVFVPDQSYLSRTGIADALSQYMSVGGTVVNLDHHIDNSHFGTINVVDYSASAACVVVYELIRQSTFNLSPLAANALLVGILYDTGNFTNSATNERALEVAGQCYAAGANGRQAVRHLYYTKSMSQLKLWGRALEKLSYNSRYGLAVTVLTDDDFSETGSDVGHTEGLANFFNNMAGVKGVLILRDLGNGKLRGSFRTTRDDIDLGKLAQTLGGGGHRKACGFTIEGSLVRNGKSWMVE